MHVFLNLDMRPGNCSFNVCILFDLCATLVFLLAMQLFYIRMSIQLSTKLQH